MCARILRSSPIRIPRTASSSLQAETQPPRIRPPILQPSTPTNTPTDTPTNTPTNTPTDTPNQYTNRYANEHAHGYPDQYTNHHRHTNQYAHRYGNTDRYPNKHAYRHGNANRHADQHTDEYTHEYTCAADGHTDQHTDQHTNEYTHQYADDTHQYTCAADRHTDQHTDQHTNEYTHQYANEYTTNTPVPPTNTPTNTPTPTVSFGALTPGYWKNHKAQATALLPISLGNYAVNTFTKAKAVFAAMNCGSSKPNDAIGCLAGHLLAAKLNVKNGADACIQPTINKADAFLSGQTVNGVPGINYTGPSGTYKLSAAQRSFAITLKTALDQYNNNQSLPGRAKYRMANASDISECRGLTME